MINSFGRRSFKFKINLTNVDLPARFSLVVKAFDAAIFQPIDPVEGDRLAVLSAQ
jgi:hypothetical protein